MNFYYKASIFNLYKVEFLHYILLIFLFYVPLFVSGQPNPPVDSSGICPYGRLTPVMSILLVVFVVVLFFLAFFAIYFRHFSDVRAAETITVFPRATDNRHGIDPSVIDSFPTFVYSDVKGLKIGKGALECVVCLSEFEDDETLRLIPKCDHVFHPDCIDAWLSSHVTCPVCRTNLAEPDPVVKPDPITVPDSDVEPQQPQSTVDGVEPPPPTLQPQTMNVYDRRRGSFSGRTRVNFSRSHSTGHSFILVRPGDNTDRFTLRFPAEVRKQLFMNRKLNRSSSMVVMPREGSSRGRKSDRWVFLKRPSFTWRAGGGGGGGGSVGGGSSSKSLKLVVNGSEGSSIHTVRSESVHRLPV